MIGESEIMVNVLLLPSEHGERKKRTISIVVPSGCEAALATLEGILDRLCIMPFSLYPASRVPGHGQAGLGNSELLL